MIESAAHTNEACEPPPPIERQVKPSEVDIKNGKAIFKQKPMSFEKMTETMQEMVNFREWLELQAQRQEHPLTQIPQNYWPLIAKFTQESDKTIIALSKYIQQELAPDNGDDADCLVPTLALSAIEDVVKLLATRVNYGIETSLAKTPAALCIWRWELKPEFIDFLPRISREKVETRLVDRSRHKKDLQAIFDALPTNERNALLGVKDPVTTPSKPQISLRASSNEPPSIVGDVSDDKLSEMTANTVGDKNQATARRPGRQKTVIEPEKSVEKAAREKERLEKKAARSEKERKDKESQEKARSMMANFFGKPKASSSTTASPSKGHAPSPPNTLSDFDRVFKPFMLKKDAELAPVNWFKDAKKRKLQTDVDVIVIDEDGIEELNVEMSEPYSSPNATPREYLSRVLSGCPSSQTRFCSSSNTVRSTMTRLSEAEVSDDTVTVRALLSELHDRTRVPAKVLIFHEDKRPGYFGTFTKRSRLVKPRRPFAQDGVAIDYAYDSGAEWGEEEEGGDDVLGDSDDERDDDEDSDDMDGWLVEGEDEEATPVEERDALDAFPFLPPPEGSTTKRKIGREKETNAEGKSKKRKVVVPLVAFIKGPCWETEISNCEYEPFNQYRIQFFNDTPYPLDPFTFVSHPVDARHAPASSAASTSRVKSQPQFVIPALPPHLLNSNTPTLDSAPSSSVNSQQSQTKRSRTTPKIPFPDAHLPLLKEKVANMGTSSLIALVEALHLDLKTHRIKKNAIEAKIREICVKDQRHVWSVKGDTEVCTLFSHLATADASGPGI
ncbi:hypothetical protein B0F90DRAFT_1371375 [Multifurca ochricompacta]|uniref:Chromatin assembly factor 1 subunit A dimerization domain-containing protein n=1 Tax=Multifurca ochricompacta TaxID=376703 RepID=A0AAD4M7D5_9AGAM|nr:hypothetical protein B0F90DRAFT_1371375 [Multifurca ochricompacta]